MAGIGFNLGDLSSYDFGITPFEIGAGRPSVPEQNIAAAMSPSMAVMSPGYAPQLQYDENGRFGITDQQKREALMEAMSIFGASLADGVAKSDWGSIHSGLNRGLAGAGQARRASLDKASATNVQNRKDQLAERASLSALEQSEYEFEVAKEKYQDAKKLSSAMEKEFKPVLESWVSIIDNSKPPEGTDPKMWEVIKQNSKAKALYIGRLLTHGGEGAAEKMAALELELTKLFPEFGDVARAAQIDALQKQQDANIKLQKEKNEKVRAAYAESGVPVEFNAQGEAVPVDQVEVDQKNKQLELLDANIAATKALAQQRSSGWRGRFQQTQQEKSLAKLRDRAYTTSRNISADLERAHNSIGDVSNITKLYSPFRGISLPDGASPVSMLMPYGKSRLGINMTAFETAAVKLINPSAKSKSDLKSDELKRLEQMKANARAANINVPDSAKAIEAIATFGRYGLIDDNGNVMATPEQFDSVANDRAGAQVADWAKKQLHDPIEIDKVGEMVDSKYAELSAQFNDPAQALNGLRVWAATITPEFANQNGWDILALKQTVLNAINELRAEQLAQGQ